MLLHHEGGKVITQLEEYPIQQNNYFAVLKFYPLRQLWAFIHGPHWLVTGFVILGTNSVRAL